MWSVILVLAATVLGYVLGYLRGYVRRREEQWAELRTIRDALIDMRHDPDPDRINALIDRVKVMEESHS